MKKIFIIIIFILFIPFIVNAETKVTTSSQTPVVGENIVLRIMMEYGEEAKISEIHYSIKFDPTAFIFDSVWWPQKEGNYRVEDGTIYIDNVAESASDSWNDGSQVSIVLKVVKTGTFPIRINETGRAKYSDGSFISQYYSGVTINSAEPSGNANIHSLSVDNFDLSPIFDPSVKNYKVYVPADTTSVNVSVSKGEEHQTITGTGKRELLYGGNRVTVNIVAQNGNSNTYVIMIYREDNRTGDTSLKSVKIGNVQATYNEENQNYYALVSKSTEKAVLVATTTDPNANLIGTGEKTLEIGNNVFELTVESTNNKIQKYKVIVERMSEEEKVNVASTKLQRLTINNTTIDLSDNKEKIPYGATKDDTKLNIIALPESNTANVEISDTSLKVGANKITITVKEADGNSKIYTVIAYKPNSNYTKIESFTNLPADKTLYYNSSESNTHIIDDFNELKNKELLYNVVNTYNAPLYIVKFNNYQSTTSVDASFNKTTLETTTYKTALPANIDLTLYIGDEFEDDTYLKIYTYNEGETQILLTEGVKVVNGYINFTTNGKIFYSFSPIAVTQKKSFNINQYIVPIAIGGVAILLILIILFGKKKKVSKEPSY